MRNVFKALETAGLQLRIDKCKLGVNSVEFLGHRISFEGRSPVREYARKLQNFPQPKCVAALQRFIGVVNYYRCYIQNMSGITEPLFGLLKKGRRWDWDSRCQLAFETLRTHLTTEPVILSHPDWNCEFYIEADASLGGGGRAISIGQEHRKITSSSFLFVLFESHPEKLLRRAIRGLGPGGCNSQMSGLSQRGH